MTKKPDFGVASSRKALTHLDAIENCFHPPFWTLCGLPLYFKFQTPSPVISIPVPFSVKFWQHPDSLQIGKVVFNQQLLLQHPDSLKTGKVVFNQWLPPHLSRVYHIFMFRCDQKLNCEESLLIQNIEANRSLHGWARYFGDSCSL